MFLPIAMTADSMGLCVFVMAALGTHLDKLARLLEYYSGIKKSGQDLLDGAVQALKVEREFNLRAGLGPAYDRILEFMREEPLPVIDSVFDVPDEDLKKIFGYE